MRRAVCLILVGCLASEIALAQAIQALPPASIASTRPLAKVKKVRYLLRQIELNEKQAKHAEGLIESIFAADAAPQIDVAKIQAMVRDMQAAKAADDDEKYAALQEELKQLGRGLDPTPEFLENMNKVLEDKQKKMLKKATERLKRVPSGIVRPADILAAARALELSEKQIAQLKKAEEAFRKQVNTRGKFDDKRRLAMINTLHKRVRDPLNEDQGKKFDRQIRTIRPDLIERGLRVK